MPLPLFTSKDIKYGRAKDSPFMKRIMQNPEIAKVLQNPVEREVFYRTVKEMAANHKNLAQSGYSGNLQVLREALWKLKTHAGDRIESNEAASLAKSLIPFGPKYQQPVEKANPAQDKKPVLSKTGAEHISAVDERKNSKACPPAPNRPGSQSEKIQKDSSSLSRTRNFSRFF